MTKKPGFLLCYLPFLLVALPAAAALTTVADLGGESAAPYLDAVNGQPNEFSVPQALSSSEPPASLSVSNMLPVSTPEMTPGKVVSRPLSLPGIPPVFIVGNDDLSRSWLLKRAPELKKIGATGMVVNIGSASELDSLKSTAPAVVMVPVQGGDLARRLQLAHYPVLITADGLSQ
ncbi:integrating conjugative element protein [Salmonella enterica subsp. enterica serovar Typhimurium]|nr:integrating conjugative element protein [Salmonella enterica subsp. enterica serovar Typhimurium]EIF3372507.1 integrating conjugative element protein [Salmonella enterica subsp. enterica serovar Typhimurium]EII7205914.1 integrating conjugative element protein [Salmonella enterica subsp. enterica serovar Typhimurium]EIP0078521.1 integrating conjugative element protein [Salmonella enterica subsp. enterica serovar Typhimurium]EIW9444972.1 integrating conjugative element protein [Salmonella ente